MINNPAGECMENFAVMKVLEGLVLSTSDELQLRLQAVYMWLHDQENQIELVVTVKGNCGKVHPSIEEWQRCDECARIGRRYCSDVDPAS